MYTGLIGMDIEPNLKLDFSDVLIRPKRSTLLSRKDVSLNRKMQFKSFKNLDKNNPHYEGTPILAANMDGVGTMEMADKLIKHSMFTVLAKSYSSKELIDFFSNDTEGKRKEHVAISIGISEKCLTKLREVNEACSDKLKFLCVDVANGYSEAFSNFLIKLRKEFPNLVLIAGNVVTADQVSELILNGVDIVKVGIGPGSVCTTRIKTGVGYPQLSAVMECASAAHALGGYIIADGGCVSPGDVSKAFAAGADFVMLGGMLAGHKEGGFERETRYFSTGEFYKKGDKFEEKIEEKECISFYGMSSKKANDKHFGGLKDYRSSEGKEVYIRAKEDIDETVKDILGGLRSTCTYVGAIELKDLPKCTTFIRVNSTHNKVFG